jgi:hypothetical protein
VLIAEIAAERADAATAAQSTARAHARAALH